MSIIHIEEIQESDLHLVSKWRSNPEVNDFIRPGKRTLNEVRIWYRDYFSGEANRIFLISSNGTAIGYFTIEGIDQINRKCEFGIVIGETAFHNQGIGVSTINMMLNKAFNEMGMHRVLAVIKKDNAPSVKCFARAGFVLEGEHREARFINDEYKDVLFFSVLEHEWPGKSS